MFSWRVRHFSGRDRFHWHVVLSLTDTTYTVFTSFCCSTETGRQSGNCALRNAFTNVGSFRSQLLFVLHAVLFVSLTNAYRYSIIRVIKSRE